MYNKAQKEENHQIRQSMNKMIQYQEIEKTHTFILMPN